MMGVIRKSSLSKLLILSLFVTACDKLPVNFGLRVNDSQGEPVSCADVTGGFGIEVPELVETDEKITLNYRGGEDADWDLSSPSFHQNQKGSSVSFNFEEPGMYEGTLAANSVCNTIENHSFRIEVIKKLGSPSLQIDSGKRFTAKAQVSLVHSVIGAESMFLSSSPNCERGNWVSASDESIENIFAANRTNTFYAKFANRLQVSPCVSASITHDNLAPRLRVSGLPEKVSALADVSVGLEATDSGSGVDSIFCRVGKSGFQKCEKKYILKNLSENNYELEFYVVDKLGNKSTPVSHSFELDLTAPRLVFEKTPDLINAGGSQTYSFKVSDNIKLAKVSCSLNGVGLTNCSSPLSIDIQKEGEYHFSLSAIDSVGNKSKGLSHSFYADRQAPVVTLKKSPTNPSIEKSASFEFEVVDNKVLVGGVFCSLDAGPYSPCISGLNYKDLSNGKHEFRIYAKDALGNTSTPTSYVWEIDDGLVKEEILVTDLAKKVDILVVIDNSSSMKNEQKEMGNRFSNFTKALEGLNWQLGIITTNAQNDGEFSGGRLQNFNRGVGEPAKYVIGGEEESTEALFQRTIQRDEKGNDTEEGIKSVSRFLDRDSKILLRDGANFATIIVSDEDERSRGRSLDSENKPSFLLEKIKQRYKGEKLFSNHSIVWRPGDRDCERKGGKYEGFVYAELSRLTDGILGDVCSKDYTNQLKDIGDRIQETPFSIGLQCAPRGGDIEISMDPKPIEAVETKLVENKLFLSPYPEKGTKISLVYACDR